MHQITDAVQYMHHHNLVHGDLKMENVGITHSKRVKILDLGCTVTHGSPGHNKLRGTIKTMAPEMINTDIPVFKSSDIWSMGIIFWELITTKSFYSQKSSDYEVMIKLKKRPFRLHTWPGNRIMTDQFYQLIKSMIEVHWLRRPAIGSVYETLKTIKVV